MGTWGPGNFDGDSPCDIRDSFVREVVHRVGKQLKNTKLDIFKAEDEVMPWLAILVAVCERCQGHPPRPHIVSQWKRRYLETFDAQIEEIAGGDFASQRRNVVKSTFDKLLRLSRDLYGDYTDDELPEAGAVFLCQLEDGRFGACRVLRRGEMGDDPYYEETMLLVAASPWIGTEPPDLNNPELREILRSNHHSNKGDMELGWLSKPPPKSFKYLGMLPPSKKEGGLGPPVFLRDWTVLPELILIQRGRKS